MPILREISSKLLYWKTASTRKPILLLGARQVGKTFVIRQLANQFSSFVELNFDERPELNKVFEGSLTVSKLLASLEAVLAMKITPGETLLFLDEVQLCPRAISALRYFYEQLPSLHVIASGSLVQFAIEQIGVPVGRIEILHMFPLSFREFLTACGKELLVTHVSKHDYRTDMPEPIHSQLLELSKLYSYVGGMPEVVQHYLDTNNLTDCDRLQRTLVNTYRRDFLRYAKQRQIPYIEEVFNAIPRLLGQKFKASSVREDVRSQYINEALSLLQKAHVAHKVHTTAANGVPLGAERDLKHFKTFFVDLGLAQSLLGVPLSKWILETSVVAVHAGRICEQMVAQELLAYRAPDLTPELYYWHREARTSNAEVDFVISVGSTLVPIEIKSGSTGRLRSLQLFLQEKNHAPCGVKISEDNFSAHKLASGKMLYSIPWYACWRVEEIIA